MNIFEKGLWIVSVFLCINVYGQIPERIIITPRAVSEIVVNPGKGWVLYGEASEQPQEILPLSNLGYNRFHWADLEPEEGKYQWQIIDDELTDWLALGKKMAFGVMCASTHSSRFWVTPKWVFDAGAKYDTFELKNPKTVAWGTEGIKLMPHFDDPVYIGKMAKFIQALANRYDGHPGIEFIDIRSYGNWGEGHMYPTKKPEISPEKFKEHLIIHRKAFKKTLLQIATENDNYLSEYDWAVSQGIGLRSDGICVNRDGSRLAICEGKMPSVFELYATIDVLKERGWWQGIKDQWGRGFTLKECIEKGKPSYCDLNRAKQNGLRFLETEPETVAKLGNRLGYHFVLKRAEFPYKFLPAKVESVTVTWENKGVAYLFIPVKVSYALLSLSGKVIQVCDAQMSKPNSWEPDKVMNITDTIRFDKKRKGYYKLAVGIRQARDGLIPSIKLGTDLPQQDGWYVLGEVYMGS